MRFENLSQKTMNYYLSNNFERNKQMIREIREYINADPMNKDWIKNCCKYCTPKYQMIAREEDAVLTCSASVLSLTALCSEPTTKLSLS